MSVGVINGNRKNEQFSGHIDHNQSIGYWSSNFFHYGFINMDCNTIQAASSDLFINQGSTLVMEIDTINYIISFYNPDNLERKYVYKLSDSHWREPLYVFANMYEKDATLKWTVES